jgi:hypothetical protein
MDFNSLKSQITTALNQKFQNREAFLGETTGFTLVDGFAIQTIQDQTAGFILGGKSVPMVIVVGNTTGRIYYFALKALIPNLELK